MSKALITEFSDGLVSGKVTCDSGIYTVTGTLHAGLRGKVEMLYRAAEPSDLRLSIKGSALPFPGPRHAFGPTNSGQVQLSSTGEFKFQVYNPNSYYKNDDIANGIGHSKILIEPVIYLTVIMANGKQKVYELDLGAGLPSRSLTNYPGKPIRSTGRNTPTMLY